MMKYIPLILLILSLVILVGCGPVGDFWGWYNLPS
jgi:hypothetical protein